MLLKAFSLKPFLSHTGASRYRSVLIIAPTAANIEVALLALPIVFPFRLTTMHRSYHRIFVDAISYSNIPLGILLGPPRRDHLLRRRHQKFPRRGTLFGQCTGTQTLYGPLFIIVLSRNRRLGDDFTNFLSIQVYRHIRHYSGSDPTPHRRNQSLRRCFRERSRRRTI